MAKSALIKCAHCGSDKRISPSSVRDFNFCNNVCRAEHLKVRYSGENHPQYKGGPLTIVCRVCGKTRKDQPSQIKNPDSTFCSKGCANRFNAKNARGDKNSRWKGGVKAEKARRLAIPKNRISHRMSTLIRNTIKRWTGESKRGRSWESVVGYTAEQVLERLLSTMPEGYSWDDFQSGALHIDHIHPISRFDFSSYEDEQFRQCWALSNLQLLPAHDNMSKWNRLDWVRASPE